MGLAADAALTFRIKAALIADEKIGAGKINVNTSDGVVTLEGSVPYEAIRELAEAVARQRGAHQVVNRLQVEHPEFHGESAIIPPDAPAVTAEAGAEPVEEPSLLDRIREALCQDARVNEHLAVVRLESGVAFLSGRQETVQAWEAATEVVLRVPGVVAVENDMEVMPAV
jgi:osmotically-inducible protein OsmY